VEIGRFAKYISPEKISQSNALFGYHGDEYYFDIDIRRHFGLDEYDGDVIPYWKTETAEAMSAFHLKKGYNAGAGECVSLSAIYAAAAFVVCGIDLEDIYMVLTPLHSQNFIDINGGVITNNRRLVTKPMWFNGTELSNKAQRALQNEQITIVAHNTGCVHCIYENATMDKKIYKKFTHKLQSFLDSKLTPLALANFLRCNNYYQQYFQFCIDCRGNSRFIKAETLFHYEHMSNFRIADTTHEKLLKEVDYEDFSNHEFPKRIRCDVFIEYMQKKKPDIHTPASRAELTGFFGQCIGEAEKFVSELYAFLHTEPKLPAMDKQFSETESLKLSVDMTRQQIADYLQSMRKKNITADLAFYAFRDMDSCDWTPFVKAAVERSPVSIEAAGDRTARQCYQWLDGMAQESIYDGNRLAQPDEVVNFNTGDGIEKALTLANIIRSRGINQQMTLQISKGKAVLKAGSEFAFNTSKNFEKKIVIDGM